jgi:hypothetical protein
MRPYPIVTARMYDSGVVAMTQRTMLVGTAIHDSRCGIAPGEVSMVEPIMPGPSKMMSFYDLEDLLTDELRGEEVTRSDGRKHLRVSHIRV